VLGWVVLATWLNPLSLALFCFVPLILFMPFAVLAPNSRRVRCHHCGFDQDFTARKSPSPHHSTVETTCPEAPSVRQITDA
jgi:hypothetical protein